MKKKANVVLYFTFLIVAVVIVMITAMIAPLGARISSAFFVEGENLLRESNATISNIQDTNVKNTLTRSMDEAISAGEMNIQVATDLFQYAWVFLLILTTVIVFLASRAIVETNRGGLQ